MVNSVLKEISVPFVSFDLEKDDKIRALGGLFENVLLLNLLEGGSASKTISTWKKNSRSDIEVDFIIDSEINQVKIPVECKASLRFKKNYSKNVIYYLRATNQKTGFVVSAAPYEEIRTDDNLRVINLPV